MPNIEHLTLYKWNEIAKSYHHTLVLGNGASIAINKNFNYTSLFSSAQELGWITEEINKLFLHFNTQDFELILRMLSNAHDINSALLIQDTKTDDAYKTIRNALIKVVKYLHVDYGTVSPHMPKITDFISRFNTIISLNYDLILYWVILWANDNRTSNYFKDCFINNGSFEDDWKWMRKSHKGRTTTLVFYPHGNLSIATTFNGETKKIHRMVKPVTLGGETFSYKENLIKSIEDVWKENSYVPLFISEGGTKQKVQAIQRNGYLNTVYETVLPNSNETITIYGWSLGDNDEHILTKLLMGKPKKIAISIFVKDNWEDDALEMKNKILKAWRLKIKAAEIPSFAFFDSASQDCWNN